MKNEEDFFDLKPGAIGTVSYKKSIVHGMTEEQKQQYVSQASNARMRAFMNNMAYGMTSKDSVMDPSEAYQKARKESWNDLDDCEIGSVIEHVHVQIGQLESLELLKKIEELPDFFGWTNPHFIAMIKTIKI